MAQNATGYCIYKKGNGKFYCRFDNMFGSNWIESWGKSEHDDLESAKKVLRAFKEKREEKIKLEHEEKVFEL
jgi:hypothetical protein